MSLRKYLYTISEITICHLLIKNEDKPIMNYRKMFAPDYSIYTDDEIIELSNCFLQRQIVGYCKMQCM